MVLTVGRFTCETSNICETHTGTLLMLLSCDMADQHSQQSQGLVCSTILQHLQEIGQC